MLLRQDDGQGHRLILAVTWFGPVRLAGFESPRPARGAQWGAPRFWNSVTHTPIGGPKRIRPSWSGSQGRANWSEPLEDRSSKRFGIIHRPVLPMRPCDHIQQFSTGGV